MNKQILFLMIILIWSGYTIFLSAWGNYLVDLDQDPSNIGAIDEDTLITSGTFLNNTWFGKIIDGWVVGVQEVPAFVNAIVFVPLLLLMIYVITSTYFGVGG